MFVFCAAGNDDPGFSSFQLLPFSMLPDTVEYDQMQSGMRCEDIFSGMWSAGQKIDYSVGPPIVGFALASSARYPLKANGMID